MHWLGDKLKLMWVVVGLAQLVELSDLLHTRLSAQVTEHQGANEIRAAKQ